LVAGDLQDAAGVGVVKVCTEDGPLYALYYETQLGWSVFVAGGRPVEALPGERWRVIINKSPLTGQLDLLRCYAENEQGNKYQASAPIPKFTANYIRTGGRNLHHQNDMGVSGHLETVAETATDLWTFMPLDPTLRIPNRDAPRYVMVKGSGGWGRFGGGSYYLQDYSDIHAGATPTPGAGPDCE